MNAMTWFDHETGSIWSQPWGTAISGPLKGARLDMIPISLAPWASWKAEHPETLALATAGRRFGRSRSFPHDDFVVGVVLEDNVKAYRYTEAVKERVINDSVGPHPVVVLGDPETRDIHIYLRDTGRQVLTFALRDGKLVDNETGTAWDAARGLGQQGPLKGTLLKEIPYSSAFDWAWLDFYPNSSFYKM